MIEIVSLHACNMIVRINESKTTKLISCHCKCRFHGRKYNLNQKGE